MQTEEQAILALIARYSDSINHRDWDAVRATFAQDAVWKTCNFRDIAHSGGDAIVAGLRAIIEPMALLVQIPGATVVRVDGDTASARSTMQEFGKFEGGSFQCLGSYADTVSRQDGEWRFVRREFTYLYWADDGMGGQAFQASLYNA